MPQFHETGYGKTFFEHQLPELTRQLKRIADVLEAQEKRATAKPFKSLTDEEIRIIIEKENKP